MRFALFLLSSLLSLSLAGCASGASSSLPSAPHNSLGKRVAFSLPTDSGDLFRVPAAGAKATVLDFWAPSCVPCRDSLPALHARRAELEATGARLVLVAVLSTSESTDDARKTLETWGAKGAPFLIDRERVTQREAGVEGLPATLILDQSGTVKWVAPLKAPPDAIVKAAAAAADR